MKHVVLDTNVLVSGWLWSGAPSRAIREAPQFVNLLTSEALVDELRDVLSRPKFAKRLALLEKTNEQIVAEYLQIAQIVEAVVIPTTIHDDPDDDIVLGCAVGGKADYIVTGDPHLLTVQQFEGIFIITVSDLLALLSPHDTE
jgi:putative PIN family toxin of toxin-antitoxin system